MSWACPNQTISSQKCCGGETPVRQHVLKQLVGCPKPCARDTESEFLRDAEICMFVFVHKNRLKLR